MSSPLFLHNEPPKSAGWPCQAGLNQYSPAFHPPKNMKHLALLALLVCAPFLANCSGPITPNPAQKTIKQAEFVNPHTPGTYDHFLAKPSYPNNQEVWTNQKVLAKANSSNTSIIIDLSLQRGFLMVGKEIAMDYRVSTGKSSHPTPLGNFTITEKVRDKRSNLYGTIYNAAGKAIEYNADTRKSSVPEGGKYVGAPMFYWMRLTNDGIGMHQGVVGARYASHGCIRCYSSAVSVVYSKVKIGTPVKVIP